MSRAPTSNPEAAVNPFQMVVAIVFLVTIGKVAEPVARALAQRIAGRRLDRESRQPEEASGRLSETTERLENAEARIEQLEEKLRFVERLLASRPSRPELSPPASPPSSNPA